MAFRGTGEGITHFMKRMVLFSIPVLILFLFSASIALAQVQARIRVIQASNEGSSIDPALRDVHDQLGSLFSFTSYRLLRDETLPLSLNRPIEIPVHKGRAIELSLTGQRREIAEIRVKIKGERTDILNTQVRLSPGRTVLIGGPKHGQGVTIIALSARF
jgi:hypothetical protein